MKVEAAHAKKEYTSVRTMRGVVRGLGSLLRSLMSGRVRGRRGSMGR